MIKKILLILLLAIVMIVLCGCNNSSDVSAKSANKTKAYIKVNGTTIIVDVDSYFIGSNGAINVYGTDKNVYKTHLINVVLITEGE